MKTETLNLKTRNGASTAFVALPAEMRADAKSPAVILIHEWWGINNHIRDIASRYAEEGFLCVAPDLFRGKTASDAQQAAKLMSDLAIDDGIATIKSAVEETTRAYSAEKIGITGFCMGGTFALRAACEISTFKASAPFYGDIPDDATLSKLRVSTLFIAGARDQWINIEKVNTLKEAARKHNLPLEVKSYDADHAFFNDTRPEVYNAQAARDAWQRVLTHFREHL